MLGALATLGATFGWAGQAWGVQGDLGLLSRASGIDGAVANGNAVTPVISDDGRFVAYSSVATNLHPDDPDATEDVFVRDRLTNTTTLVSRATGAAGAKGNGHSRRPEISADGRFVVFHSQASNLDPDDADASSDIFVRDLQANETILVSRASGAAGAKGNSDSSFPTISADGRFVAFHSQSSNLHADDTDATQDAFVRDLLLDTTTLVSRAGGSAGAKANANSFSAEISDDGQSVAFNSVATNLDPADADPLADVYVRDLDAETTTLVTRASGAQGAKANAVALAPSISADGRRVAFYSMATNLHADDADANPDSYVRDLQTDSTMLVSRASGASGAKGDGDSDLPDVSADGRHVTFRSEAANLDPADADATSDVFVRDLDTDETTLVSRAAGAGAKSNQFSSFAQPSADGRYISFHSGATNLDPDDTSGDADVFVRTVRPDPPRNLSAPELSGRPVSGAQLSCSDGEWTDGTLSHAWRRNGEPIAAATAPTYVPTPADAGAVLDCLVTATNADGSASSSSNATLISEPLEAGAPAIKLLALLSSDRLAGRAGRKMTARFATSGPGVARLALSKRGRSVAATTIEVARDGIHKARLGLSTAAGKPLRAGRYTLALELTGADGQRATDSARVRLRRQPGARP